MEHGEIEREVVDFILEHIESVPHLEALLLLWQSPGRPWTCAELAGRIYVPDETCRSILEDLSRRGFVRPAGGSSFAANEQWPQRDVVVPRLADAHKRHLVHVTTLIHSKAAPAVREFARAFQLKKDK